MFVAFFFFTGVFFAVFFFAGVFVLFFAGVLVLFLAGVERVDTMFNYEKINIYIIIVYTYIYK